MSGWNPTIEEVSLSHLDVTNSKVSPFWLDKLRKVEKISSLKAISSLTPDNVLGYKKGEKTIFEKSTMMGYAVEQKAKHPDKIVLLRMGDFYETYGIDAILLSNHAGLNLMKNDIKAGCPWRNVQQTLDSMTDAGFSVVIYEEISEVDAGPGPSGKPASKMKNRAQAFIVTPGRRIYPHALTLKRDLEEFPADRPYIGIKGSPSSGYYVVEISLEDKKVTPHSRLSEEAVRTLLDAAGAVHPIYVQDVDRSRRQHLLGSSGSSSSGEVEPLTGYSQKDFRDIVLRMVCLRNGIDEKTMSTFRTVTESSTAGSARHIYSSTAAQIGLKPNPNIPDLVPHLLSKGHKAHSARFLREWLSSPPPKDVALHMQQLCNTLYHSELSLRSNAPFIIRKVLTLLDSRQCNANVFREIADCTTAAMDTLEKALKTGDAGDPDSQAITEHLLAVVSHRAGTLRIDAADLLMRSREMVGLISDVVASADKLSPVSPEDQQDLASGHVPNSGSAALVEGQLSAANADVVKEFFSACEIDFRGHVIRGHPELEATMCGLEQAAAELVQAIVTEFPSQSDAKESKLVFKNGKVYLARDPKDAGVEGIVYQRPYDDKKQKYLAGSTTESVAKALSAYLDVAEKAPAAVEAVLQGLCARLDDYQMTVVLISNWALILQAVSSHVVASRQKSWALPTLVEFPSPPSLSSSSSSSSSSSDAATRPSLQVDGLSAWWMDRSDPSTRLNKVALDGIFLLTAPNMSGKSTIMRAVLAAALLANSGLFVPCDAGAKIPMYDSFFLRTSSYDVPSEGKSSFALEMDDMRVILRDSTSSSLVMIDELGRGTSSRDGSALAGAILERLDSTKVNGIFATHLHEITQLPLDVKHIQNKRMCSHTDPVTGRVTWNYTLEDGMCTDSMALATAQEFDIEDSIIQRAMNLQDHFDQQCRGAPAATGSDKMGEETDHDDEGMGLSLRHAEEQFYMSQSQQATSSGYDYDYGAGLGGSVSEEYERQDVQALLEMTLRMQSEALKEKKTKQEESMSLNMQSEGLVVPKADGDKQGAAAAVAAAASSSSGSYSLDTVLDSVRSLAGTKQGVSVFEEGYDPAASLEGHSCVYLLLVRGPGAPDAFYVGETETVGARVQTHRMKTFKGSSVHGAVVKAPNKSTARLMETRIIGSLKRSGYLVLNDSDGAHTSFGSARM
jgi:hypothetical protein